MAVTGMMQKYQIHAIAEIGIILIFMVMYVDLIAKSEAQTEDEPIGCAGTLPFDTSDGQDMTDLLLESYDVYYSDPERYAELEQIFLDAVGGDILWVTFYAMDEAWVVVHRTRNKKIVLWAGKDWTVGLDGELHQATCYVLVPNNKHYKDILAQYPMCYYPEKCES